jgi:hypothetical protein
MVASIDIYGGFTSKSFYSVWAKLNHNIEPTRGRCYDHNFLRFSPIIWKVAFFIKTNVMIHFLQNSAVFCIKNGKFLQLFWRKKKLKSYVCNISPKQFFQVPPLSNQKPFLRGSVIPLPVGFTYVPTYRQVAILLWLLDITAILSPPCPKNTYSYMYP